MAASDFREILDDFRQDARELLESAERTLLEMERTAAAPGPERLTELKRTLHTIKGNSGMMGFDYLAELAHLLEDVLPALSAPGPRARRRAADRFLAAVGAMRATVTAEEIPEEAPPSWGPLRDELQGLGTAEPEEATADAVPDPSSGGAGEAPEAADAADAAGAVVTAGGAWVRVGAARLDGLLELAAEVHILLTGLADRLRRSAGDPAEAPALTIDMERVTRAFGDLESGVFALRLVPVGGVFSRFHRLVRDLAHDQGKEIELIVQGDETTLDKAVVDELAEPLLHLVRNSVDHGIETPAEREAAGKPRRARVTLAARQSSNLVEIAVVDDGRGLDSEHIRRKAESRGMRVEGLSEAEVLELIFLPGFSTRDAVTEISGRGVGLDVVKTTLERFGGAVSVQSIPGRGTEVRLTVPLTLAVAQALLVLVDGETFAVPTTFVVETFRLEAAELHEVSARGMLYRRGVVTPVVDAGVLVGTRADGSGADREHGVVLGTGLRRKVLLVDKPLGHQVIVLKPLDDALGKPFGLAGATLLGDGRIVMILDARQIVEAHLDALAEAAR